MEGKTCEEGVTPGQKQTINSIVYATIKVLSKMYKEGTTNLKINEESAAIITDRIIKEYFN